MILLNVWKLYQNWQTAFECAINKMWDGCKLVLSLMSQRDPGTVMEEQNKPISNLFKGPPLYRHKPGQAERLKWE